MKKRFLQVTGKTAISGGIVFGLALILAGCAADISKRFKFSLVEPVDTMPPVFQDETVRVTVLPDFYEIRIRIENLTWEPVVVYWNDIRYINPDRMMCKTIHGGIKLQDKDVPQNPTEIPAREALEESLIPDSKIKLSTEGWYIEPLFAEYEKRFPGFEINLILPVEGPAGRSDYRIRIKAANQKQPEGEG